ncbi:ArsR/SmtB family transcription factor [Desulfoferrobacter suflitae]|uniref:ArsR/SmtB family transcription factor n=1 Tax=Desulfoferrobacter suflitae TaxID=2865782 RepID=UPI00216442C1|nr:metalloregulator ArsR/SmtB family transcription factor [Desulfoferrobacter suflitae]MCK8603680.1 metalloregulator ArsR/SmtB family transcription factor [Desulfoferrobacter suflitae]
MKTSAAHLQSTQLTLRNLLQITKALSDEQRVRTLMLLEEGELCVCQLIELLGLAPSTVSKHLSILRTAGLIDCRKDGRWAYYRLADGNEAEGCKPAVEWLRQSLAEDRVIQNDRAKRAEVLDSDLEELCQRQRKAC